MRFPSALSGFLVLYALAAAASGQTCTGLCLQQISCPNGGTTSISGVVYAPNGTDPLPNVLVYIPNAPVDAFTPGVSCTVAGTPPSGSPLVGTTTSVDGSFTIDNVPVGTNIPIVIQSGRWRRQLTVPVTTGCAATTFSTRMPRNHTEGDIPKFAIVTGSQDQVECVLLKMQVDPAEFQAPGGPGRIDLYAGDLGPGAQIQAAPATPPGESMLMSNNTILDQYDVLMLPCQGTPGTFFSGVNSESDTELSNFASFADNGGRVYSSHYSFIYIDNNSHIGGAVANWYGNPQQTPNQNSPVGTVDTSFAQGETLAQWLQLVGATTTFGQMPLQTVRHDMSGVVAPTQSWLTLNDAGLGNPVMQFVYNTPLTAKNQCGRVLFNEYHVENPTTASSKGAVFPTECPTDPTLTPQEKLLEYSLFELTNDGGTPTLSPLKADFGSEAVGFTTAVQNFTWTNNSTFPATATPSASGDFLVTSNNCYQIAGGTSCTIGVAFRPTALGARIGTLTVNSSGPSLTAALTGMGTPDLLLSATTLQFGSTDVGKGVSQVITISNPNPASLPFPGAVLTGDYSATSNCGGSVAAMGTCLLTVTFTPTTTGDRMGTLAVGATPAIPLDGNGLDFTLVLNPTSGQVIAGLNVMTSMTTVPLAGFNAGLTTTCSTSAPATTCIVPGPYGGGQTAQQGITIQTISEYTVVGYTGLGGPGMLWLVGAGTGLLLLVGRRKQSRKLVTGLLILMVGIFSLSATGCSGKIPEKHTAYTAPGTYTVTVSVTDGFLGAFGDLLVDREGELAALKRRDTCSWCCAECS